MKIHLKELFEIVGEVRELDFLIGQDELEEYSSYDFTAPIAVKVKAENRAGIVTVELLVDFTLRHSCDRCLKEFEREYSYTFSHTVVNEIYNDDDNDELVVCENNVLQLNELVMSDILLELPTKILCRDDCRGLCFVCGQNLNEGSCSCSAE